MPDILLRAAASGAEIAKVAVEPLEPVARLRRAAVAAGHGGPAELRCGLRLMCGSEVLRDSATMEASGLGGGGTVDVVKVPALEFWRESNIAWNSIQVPLGGALGEGAKVQQVGFDRLVAFPARPAWRRYLEDPFSAFSPGSYDEELEASALSDFIGPYEIKRFEASDVWLIGANEPVALEGSVKISSGYISTRRIALPLPEGHAIHAFKLESGCATVLLAPGLAGEAMEGLKDGMLQKFRLHGLDEEDLRAARFEAEGAPVPFKFKFPAVSHGHDPRVEGYDVVMRDFNWLEGDQSDGRRGKGFGRGSRRDGIFGRDRCGQLLARYCDQQDPGQDLQRGFNFEVCELREGAEPWQLATWKAVGHINHTCQALGDRLMLMPTRAGEDAFYESMQLIEWPTQSKVREVPLQFRPSYIESEWPRGILAGSTQTFFTCHEIEELSETVFVFATPEI
ncbi:unnamed protein product [Symbiodinium sp. CCMP2592]|nr:unnamed protein product [Symbiodinium sp. CCMP2592]